MDLAPYIESTDLRTVVTGKEIDALVHQAIDYGFLGVCVPPFWVKRASREIGQHPLRLVTVVGFPLGYQMTETKVEETKLAIRDGAHELDVVINISAIKDGIPWPKIELARLSKLIHESGCLMKVIIECPLLTDAEMEAATKLCVDAGADFVKTSTGTTGVAVDPGTVAKLRRWAPAAVGIKASGGIKTYEQAVALIQAGADRLGTSSGVKICQAPI
jgi:deoxyribose-phosphate aldolase